MPVILFVDDNEHVRQHCQRELGREGYRVVLCADGQGALQQLRRQVPDLVVLDMHMPRLDGPETARLLRARVPDLPILFFTVKKEGQDGRVGTTETQIEKSEDLTELKAQVARVLARPASRRASEVAE